MDSLASCRRNDFGHQRGRGQIGVNRMSGMHARTGQRRGGMFRRFFNWLCHLSASCPWLRPCRSRATGR